MNIASRLSGHWTDEQIVEHMCGVGPDDGHLDACAECRQRFSAMQEQRRKVEHDAADSTEPSPDFLAAQRRAIYGRLATGAAGSRLRSSMWRWASAGAMLVAVGGGLFLFEDGSHFELARHRSAAPAAISDSQLAAEVSQIADSAEPTATEPLEALFTE